MLFNHRYKKASLVPVSCWATIRNGNSISADFTEDIIENYYNDTVSAISDKLSFILDILLDFLTLQDKHNTRILSINIKLIYTHRESDQKSLPKTRFPICF